MGDGEGAPRSAGCRILGLHIITIHKTSSFGFRVQGQVSNGDLAAPLQYISVVVAGGAAEVAGAFRGDRILEVNNVSVEGSTLKQMVDRIKSGGDSLTLTFICLPESEVEKLDFNKKRSLSTSSPLEKQMPSSSPSTSSAPPLGGRPNPSVLNIYVLTDEDEEEEAVPPPETRPVR